MILLLRAFPELNWWQELRLWWLSCSSVVLVLCKLLDLIMRLSLHLNLKLKMSKQMVSVFDSTLLMVSYGKIFRTYVFLSEFCNWEFVPNNPSSKI